MNTLHVPSFALGALLALAIFIAAQPTTAQPPTRLFVTHPTTGAAIPVSGTAEGYINVKVIP